MRLHCLQDLVRSNLALEQAGAAAGKRLSQLDKLLVEKSNQVFQVQAISLSNPNPNPMSCAPLSSTSQR